MRIPSGFERSQTDAHWRRCVFVKAPQEVVLVCILLIDPALKQLQHGDAGYI